MGSQTTYSKEHSILVRPRWLLAAVYSKCSLTGVPQWHRTEIHPIVDCHKLLQGHKHEASKSRSVALSLVCLDSVTVWLSCQGISVLALLCQVLVTTMYT